MKRENASITETRKPFKVIVGREVTRESVGEYSTDIDYIWDAVNPIYESVDYDSAKEEYNRRVEEEFRDHLMLIVDFGLMSRGQYIRFFITSGLGYKSEPNDIQDYVALNEFHVDHVAGARASSFDDSDDMFIVACGKDVRQFKLAADAFEYFNHRCKHAFENVSMKLDHRFERDGRKLRRIRLVATKSALKLQRNRQVIRIRTTERITYNKLQMMEQRIRQDADQTSTVEVEEVAI